MYTKDLNGKIVRITSKQAVKENFDTGSGIDTNSWMAWGIPLIAVIVIAVAVFLYKKYNTTPLIQQP